MLTFATATHCSNIKKSTVFGEYLDPLAILEEFKLTLHEKSIAVKSAQAIDASPFPGFGRMLMYPLSF